MEAIFCLCERIYAPITEEYLTLNLIIFSNGLLTTNKSIIVHALECHLLGRTYVKQVLSISPPCLISGLRKEQIAYSTELPYNSRVFELPARCAPAYVTLSDGRGVANSRSAGGIGAWTDLALIGPWARALFISSTKQHQKTLQFCESSIHPVPLHCGLHRRRSSK